MEATSVVNFPPNKLMLYVHHLHNLRDKLEKEGSELDKEPEGRIIHGTKKRWVLREVRLLEELLLQIGWAKRFYSLPLKEIVFNQSSLDTPRYLCISNGFQMWCLDLKVSNSHYDVPVSPPLVTLTELNLPDKCVPVSPGLFKFRSNAYMIGGQHLSTSVAPSASGVELYEFLGQLYLDGVDNCPSCDTYLLSLDDHDDDTPSLSLSKCNSFGQLNKPKLWPLVEKIDGKVHVFDYASPFLLDDPCPGRSFSHEFLNPGGDSWTDISTFKVKEDIRSHLVVGNRIYAVTDEQYLMFDSNTNVGWEATPRSENSWRDPFTVEQLWNILELGMSRCVGEFPDKEGSLFVVVAVARDWGSPDGGDCDGIVAVAYLVTLTGRVLCCQHIPQFFEEPLPPSYMVKGTMIDVDEEGKTLCTIVEGDLYGIEDCDYNFLYINTFSIEMLTDAASKLRRLKLKIQLQLEARGRKPASCCPVEEDFVRVVVKDKYIYMTAVFAKEGERPYSPSLQACFL